MAEVRFLLVVVWKDEQRSEGSGLEEQLELNLWGPPEEAHNDEEGQQSSEAAD